MLNLNAPGAVAEAEADRLVHVFVNLINNTIKYGAIRGGAIEIESAFTDRRYRMTVADSGPGIPERDRERVFEKFVRGAQPETSGAGLGLPISRGIIRQFSGDLVLLDRARRRWRCLLSHSTGKRSRSCRGIIGLSYPSSGRLSRSAVESVPSSR
jgi:signal transduction histidine kinase